MSNILYNELELKQGEPFVKGQWKRIAIHSDKEIRGFFGDYRFLSNMWPARVFLDGAEYPCSKNAYMAAKFKPEERVFFQNPDLNGIEAKKEANKRTITTHAWSEVKYWIMHDLLVHKFDKNINPELYARLKATGAKYLEETNWWEDIYWGVHKSSPDTPGVGENKLGKILMDIRARG